MKSLQSFPRIPLAVLPTPIQKLENISRILGTNVYIKRDDLTGIGLGGNKVRKLEFLLADAKRQGAEVVFTTGGAQSNHAMLTAACAKKLGMTPILILKKRGVTDRKGNQLLEYLMDTDVRFMDTDSYDDIYAEMDQVGQALGRPYYKIPCGGSNAIGALGYVNCMKEIADTGMKFDYVCCAEGRQRRHPRRCGPGREALHAGHPGGGHDGGQRPLRRDHHPHHAGGGPPAGAGLRPHHRGRPSGEHVRPRLRHPLG